MATQELRDRFRSPDDTRRPLYYFELPDPREEGDFTAALTEEVEKCRRCGCSTLIPQLPVDTVITAPLLVRIRQMYETVLKNAERLGLAVGFYLDPAFEHAVIHAMGEIGEHSLRAKLLHCKEYPCERNTLLKKRLTPGDRQALVAFSEDTGECIDLREFVQDGTLCWQVPSGNYTVREYLCIEDTEREGANYLSYEASMGYIRGAISLFSDTFAPYLGKTLRILAYSGVGFNGRNRRSWDTAFNDNFQARFGFDPAPHYPVLFAAVGKDGERLKAYFMTVRAAMLQNGILRALHDAAAELGLSPFGSLSEPKLTACSFSIGDAMLSNSLSPCALFDKAYMYGTNSIKIAAGAAYNFDLEQVNGELFRNYASTATECLYNDAINAFARGVNHTGLHLSPALTENSDFCDFAARAQTLLRGGRHVADIAMLYPIYHLHSQSGLYFSPTSGYEYPSTPATADYMTLINSISLYSGHDLTLLHPETLNERCSARDGVLYLNNERNRESFRVVVLPATSLISLSNLRVLKEFYDGGGKLIATGVLPTAAAEYDPTGAADAEVRRLTEKIFGHDACDPTVMRNYCYTKNAAGGEAIFLYFNATAADGTQMTRSTTVNQALNSFELPFDIYLPGMPRLEIIGALNACFPEFRTLDLHRAIPGGGMLNHIHKSHADHDVYYFSNTTKTDYEHHVLLRGAFTVEEWDPHTGRITERNSKLLSYKDRLYTTLRLSLPGGTSTFFYAKPIQNPPNVVEKVESIGELETQHDALMSEF